MKRNKGRRCLCRAHLGFVRIIIFDGNGRVARLVAICLCYVPVIRPSPFRWSVAAVSTSCGARERGRQDQRDDRLCRRIQPSLRRYCRPNGSGREA